METTLKDASHSVRHAPPIAAKRRSILGYLRVLLSGFLMGSADVVPGVSGGTMAFLLGIYEELIESIRMVGRAPFLNAIRSLRIGEAARLINLPFLLSIMVGILLAIFTLAPGIEWMLLNQPILIWSFFFGLVLASVFSVSRRIPRWNVALALALALGAIGAYWIVGLVPVQTPEAWWFLFISGAIAICAMILPGISGSFILVLLGKYQFLVSAVNQRDIVPLIWTALGCAVGIVSFAQLLSWLFRRYHDLTVAVLTGFMLGSLRKVWPWKETISYITDRHGAILPTVERNMLPPLTINGALNNEIIFALVMALVGLTLVLVIDFTANKKQAA